MSPVTAPVGTVVRILLSGSLESLLKVAFTLLNFTMVAPVNPEPKIATLVPTGPLGGVKLLMPFWTVKLVELVLVPDGVITLMAPVVALNGTPALIEVAETTAAKVEFLPLKLTAVA